MIGAPTVVAWPAAEGPAKQGSRRPFKRALGIALGMVAMAALAALLVGLYENHPLTAGASAHVQLPGDLFAAPPKPAPRVIVRYAAPRSMPAAPAAPAAAPTSQPSEPAQPIQPTPSPRHHPSPSPSPSPSGGGDD